MQLLCSEEAVKTPVNTRQMMMIVYKLIEDDH